MSRKKFLITTHWIVRGESWMEREAVAISGAYVRDEIIASQFYPVLG